MDNTKVIPRSPHDAIDTAQQFHAELGNAQRGSRLVSHSRDRKARLYDGIALALLMALMAALGVIGFALAAPAKADYDPVAYAYASTYASAVCSTLDDYPSVNGMRGIMAAIQDDGLTPYQAGQAVGISIYEVCPNYGYLVDAFVAQYGAKSSLT